MFKIITPVLACLVSRIAQRNDHNARLMQFIQSDKMKVQRQWLLLASNLNRIVYAAASKLKLLPWKAETCLVTMTDVIWWKRYWIPFGKWEIGESYVEVCKTGNGNQPVFIITKSRCWPADSSCWLRWNKSVNVVVAQKIGQSPSKSNLTQGPA